MIRDAAHEEDQRAEHRPPDRRGTAEQQRGVAEERDVAAQGVGLHRRRQDVHHAADRAEQAADDQGLHLDGEHVLAEAADGILVFADARAASSPHGLRASRKTMTQHSATSTQATNLTHQPSTPVFCWATGARKNQQDRQQAQADQRPVCACALERDLAAADPTAIQISRSRPASRSAGGSRAVGHVEVVERQQRGVAVAEEGEVGERVAVLAAGDALGAAGEVEQLS